MTNLITEEFRTICIEIADSNKTSHEWAAIESDDMFQTDSYVGGYDADEEAFCFSFYDEQGKEFWFQLILDEVIEVSKGNDIKILLRDTKS